MSDKPALRCENCARWTPNTVAEVMGWCSLNGGPVTRSAIESGDVIRFLLMCTAYTHTCKKHQPREAPHD